MNHVVFVQMLLEVSRLADFQSSKHCFRVAALAVIRRQHIGSDGLPEPSRTAVADITFHRAKNAIGVCNHPGFVNINLRVQRNLKSAVVRIHKATHCLCSFPQDVC